MATDFQKFAEWAQQNPNGTVADFERSQAAPLDFVSWAQQNPHGTYADFQRASAPPPDFPTWAQANPNGTYAQYSEKFGGAVKRTADPVAPAFGGFDLNTRWQGQPQPQPFNAPQPSRGPSIAYGGNPAELAGVNEATEDYTDPYTQVRYRLTFTKGDGKAGQSYHSALLPNGKQTHVLYDSAYSLSAAAVA